MVRLTRSRPNVTADSDLAEANFRDRSTTGDKPAGSM